MNRRTIAGMASVVSMAITLIAATCAEETEEVVYQLVPVSNRDISVSVSAAGSIEPIKTVQVKSKASGEIFAMPVETGDAVRAGDLLVQVDPRIPQATLRQARADIVLAQAQLENAQSRLRRSESLHETESITEQEYEDAKLAVANARASLVRAERSLEDARISAEDTDVRSPINGVVIDKRVEMGTVITSAIQGASGGTVLLQMANLDTVQVRALVDETDVAKLQAGQWATITVDAYPNRPFRGRVLKIEPQAQVQQNVTMFPVLVRIPNGEGLLIPGMSSEVEVSVGDRRGVMAIPNAALRTQRDYGSAAGVLGLDPEALRAQLARTRAEGNRQTPTESRSMAGDPEQNAPDSVRAGRRSMGSEQGMPGDRRRPTDRAQAGPGATTNIDILASDYLVFTMRNGQISLVPVRTGLTDLNYSEILSGLSASDTVLVLSSVPLVSGGQERPRGGGGGRPGGGRPPR